jgi:hypothetical protein
MDGSPTRVERRAQDKRRSRVGLAVGAAVVVVVAAVVVGILVSSGGDDSGDRGGGGESASRPVANTDVRIEAGEVTADSAGPPVSVSPEITGGVIDLIRKYLELATVEPLRRQQAAGDLSGVFDTAALARATGPDRALLVDEGMPKVTGDLDVTSIPIALTGLGDLDGNLVLVTANVAFDVQGDTGAEEPLHIQRFGSLVVTPDAAGSWKISAYKLYVERTGGGLETAPTTTAVVGQ